LKTISHECTRINTTKKPVHRKGREGRKGNQNPNYKGTRRETQGHEGKKQRNSSRENKIYKVSNAETAEKRGFFEALVIRRLGLSFPDHRITQSPGSPDSLPLNPKVTILRVLS
jgi:hypothetical protein